ncbi:putative nuclear pore complex protein [Chloropicon primus]|uniref:Putative nuclear pore complex protein n=1 Tax=Chloropicon primus TaxID=1764295 RepID=A0A5B8MJH3_9CHLO|nr:putative nuclear pore complex protein [Chloropicon primus]UPQ99035.1 putative nuclear pore complex protein [Chloropicon primus]|eukprot:QDZ19825.1 putative nuclear pore complex protein [Chloropicon primus]
METRERLSWPCTSFRSCWEELHLLQVTDTELLCDLKPWLKNGTREFRRFTKASYVELEKAERHVDVGLKFPEGQEALDVARKHLALGLSQILNLNAVQTYVLLHKYETNEACTRKSDASATGRGTEDSELVFKVCEFYFQERQALLECVLEVLRNELRDEPDVKSLQLKDVVGRMDRGLVDRALSSLNASVSDFPSHHFAPAYQEETETEGGLGRCPNKTAEVGLQKYWTEQQTLEQLLLTQQIFLFYYQEDNVPCKGDLDKMVKFTCDMQLDSISSSLSPDAAKNVMSTLSTSVFIFLEMLDVDGLLEMLALGTSQAQPDLSKWNELDLTGAEVESIGQPHFTLVWAVSQQLKHVLNSKHAKVGSNVEQVASNSISHGALDRLVFALSDDVVRSGTDSTAYHSVLKNFSSALLVAFELTPKRLPHNVLDALTSILVMTLSGEPALVEQFWDEDYALDQPIRNFLGECQQLFPTLPIPYMRLLQALCEAVHEASANLVNDQVLNHFRDLRSVSVFHSPSDLMDAASEMHMRHQVQERMHLQIGRQVRIVKNSVYQLPDCPGLFLDDKVIGNVLEYYQDDGRDSSESKYLVSWMVDIDGYFLILSRLHSFSLSTEILSNSEEIQLSFKLLSSVLTNSMNHWEELMAVKINENEIRLLDVAALIFDRYKTILAHAKKEEADVCLRVLSSCLHLAVAVSTCDPKLIGSWLRTVVGGAGSVSQSNLSDPAQCIPTVADIYRNEVSTGSFEFTITFLKLANSLVEKAVFGPESALYLYFGTFGVLSNIQTMTFLFAHQRLDLVSAALNLVHNSLRVYELLHSMRRVQNQRPLRDFDWTEGRTSFTEDMDSFLTNKFSIAIVMRSSMLLSEASRTEVMHAKGQNLLASKMEACIQTAGKLLLRLLAMVERDSLNQDVFPCIVSNFMPSGSESLVKVVTSYCEYQFDLNARQLAFDVMKGVARLASRLDNIGLLQCCYPYSLTSAESSKLLHVVASSLSEESLLGNPELFTSTVEFLTLLVHVRYPFPPVIIPGYDSRSENKLLSLWIRNLCLCLVNDECRTKQPSAYCALLEFLDCAWVSGLSFITQGILENKASWNTIEELASSTQQWNSLGAAWTFKFSDFGQDYFCRIHACALNILAHEFFLSSRGYSAHQGRAASIKSWVETNFSNIILEFASIKIDVSTRQRLQVKLRSLLVESSSIANVFSHMGIRALLTFVEENFPRGSEQFPEDISAMQPEDLNQSLQFSSSVERLFLCCLESRTPRHSMWLKEYEELGPEKFAVDFSILSQDYMAMQKTEAIQSLVRKINAQSQVEAAAMSLSKAASSIAFIAKEQKDANFDCLDLTKFLDDTVETLNWSLGQLTNHDVCNTLFTAFSPIEELVLTFNKSLVQVCSTALTIGLDHDLLDDDWVDSLFYATGESTEWMHNWLTFLLSSPSDTSDSGVGLSIKLLSLLHTVYSNVGEAGGVVSIGMETVLKSFSLSCSFCHSSKDLKLSSLLVMKCIIDDWLSPKMSHGDWIPLLEESPAKMELCKLGEESYPSELRSMLLVTAASLAETGAGASTLIDWWKEFGTFRQLIKYASFLVSRGDSSSAEWCSWLELVGTLLYVCSDLMSSTDGIAALRVFTSALTDELHPYIVTLLSSFSNNDRKLKLGELVIVKHVAFLLYALSKFAGRWHLALPSSIVNVQDSVVIFLVYAAQPALKPYFYVESQLLDEKEVSLHKGKDGSILVEGWFGAVKPEIAKGPKVGTSLAVAPMAGSSKYVNTPERAEVKTSRYTFQIAHTMYTNVCYFLEFLLISLPSAESRMRNADAFKDSLLVSLIGIQIQSIHISAGLCNAADEHEMHGDLLKLFGRILNLSTYVQEIIFKSSLGFDKHGRNSWRLMSNLTAAYGLLKQSMEGLLAKVDKDAVDGSTGDAMSKMLSTLRAGGERWAGILSSDEALLTTSNLYPM